MQTDATTPKCDHPTDTLVGFRRQTRRCTRDATYTDGVKFYCTQHAKEPATMMRKGTGKIRADLRPITTDSPSAHREDGNGDEL